MSLQKYNFSDEQIKNADLSWNDKIICDRCGAETLIWKNDEAKPYGESKLCPNCKRDNLISLIEKNKTH